MEAQIGREMTAEEKKIAEHELFVYEAKQRRVDLDTQLQLLKASRRQSREKSLVVTKLQEAIMWLGMELKDLGTPNPYPNSYDPTNTTVDPTADGLKM